MKSTRAILKEPKNPHDERKRERNVRDGRGTRVEGQERGWSRAREKDIDGGMQSGCNPIYLILREAPIVKQERINKER